MPTVSKKQRRLMRRVASDKTFAKSKNIDQAVALEFLKADQLEAQTLVVQNLYAWLDGKDDQLWVLGTKQANVEGLAKKIASFWKATAVDVDDLVNKSVKKQGTIEETVNDVLDTLDEYKDPIVIYGYQVPFFEDRVHVFVGMELQRVGVRKAKSLRVTDMPELALSKLSKKNTEHEITKMVENATPDEEAVRKLLQYDPNDTGEKSSNESLPLSASW